MFTKKRVRIYGSYKSSVYRWVKSFLMEYSVEDCFQHYNIILMCFCVCVVFGSQRHNIHLGLQKYYPTHLALWRMVFAA